MFNSCTLKFCWVYVWAREDSSGYPTARYERRVKADSPTTDLHQLTFLQQKAGQWVRPNDKQCARPQYA